MNQSNLLTRRRAIGLIGTVLVPFTIQKSGWKAGAISADEAFRIIEKWNGRARSTEEIERIFLAAWPTIHRNGYNIRNIPCGRKVPQFFNVENVARLLRIVKSGGASDLLYIALESPLRLTHHGVVGGPEWRYYVAWLKLRIIECFDNDWSAVHRTAKEQFSLYGLFNNYRLKSCP